MATFEQYVIFPHVSAWTETERSFFAKFYMQGQPNQIHHLKFLDDLAAVTQSKNQIGGLTMGNSRSPGFIAEAIKKRLHLMGRDLQSYFGADANAPVMEANFNAILGRTLDLVPNVCRQ